MRGGCHGDIGKGGGGGGGRRKGGERCRGFGQGFMDSFHLSEECMDRIEV